MEIDLTILLVLGLLALVSWNIYLTIGKKKNDVVEVNSPKGIKNFTIISVKYN